MGERGSFTRDIKRKRARAQWKLSKKLDEFHVGKYSKVKEERERILAPYRRYIEQVKTFFKEFLEYQSHWRSDGYGDMEKIAISLRNSQDFSRIPEIENQVVNYDVQYYFTKIQKSFQDDLKGIKDQLVENPKLSEQLEKFLQDNQLYGLLATLELAEINGNSKNGVTISKLDAKFNVALYENKRYFDTEYELLSSAIRLYKEEIWLLRNIASGIFVWTPSVVYGEEDSETEKVPQKILCGLWRADNEQKFVRDCELLVAGVTLTRPCIFDSRNFSLEQRQLQKELIQDRERHLDPLRYQLQKDPEMRARVMEYFSVAGYLSVYQGLGPVITN